MSDSVEIISGSAFWECTSLKKITLGKNVKRIEDWAFDRCIRLEEVAISEGLAYIGAYAFNDCDDLATFRFSGTLREWKEIVKINRWDFEVKTYSVVCSDQTAVRTEWAALWRDVQEFGIYYSP